MSLFAIIYAVYYFVDLIQRWEMMTEQGPRGVNCITIYIWYNIMCQYICSTVRMNYKTYLTNDDMFRNYMKFISGSQNISDVYNSLNQKS